MFVDRKSGVGAEIMLLLLKMKQNENGKDTYIYWKTLNCSIRWS